MMKIFKRLQGPKLARRRTSLPMRRPRFKHSMRHVPRQRFIRPSPRTKPIATKHRITSTRTAEAQLDSATTPVPTTTISRNFSAFEKLPQELQLLISSITIPIAQSDPTVDESAQLETIPMPVKVGFPRFEELPKELQLKVWNYAAGPHGFLQISETLMARINCHIRCAGPIRIIFGHFTAPKALCLYIPQHNLATVTEIGRARRAAMSVCSASWQVALGGMEI